MSREPLDEATRQAIFAAGGLYQQAIEDFGWFGFWREVIRAWLRRLRDRKETRTADAP